MHANIEFSSHSNHHHFFLFILLLLLLLLLMLFLRFIVTHNKERNFFPGAADTLSFTMNWWVEKREKKLNEMEWKKFYMCVYMDMREAVGNKTLLKFPYDIYPNLLSWGFSYFYILFKKKSLLCVFFVLFCYVADDASDAASAAAYIDGNHTWKLSAMNWLLCVYVHVNMFIRMFVWWRWEVTFGVFMDVSRVILDYFTTFYDFEFSFVVNF